MRDSFWVPGVIKADSYALFRGKLFAAEEVVVELRVCGASWYQAYLNGRALLDGPPRFPLTNPEYQSVRVRMKSGINVLALHVHHHGVESRILKETPPFVWCHAYSVASELELPIEWCCLKLDSNQPSLRRVNPQLGWIEWRDTRLEPEDWEQVEFDDSDWSQPFSPACDLPIASEADIAGVGAYQHCLQAFAAGPLASTFGYSADEPAFAFFARDRVCEAIPAKGVWRRYDLGRVRLGRPNFTLDLPAGSVVEFGLSETLTEGRVSPYINLSAGSSCNLDHYIARGGLQTFCPLSPKGGRFLEVHILSDEDNVAFVKEEFIERCYHAQTKACFESGDAMLDRIWQVGVETYRACSEDSLTDNPTRERGQWVGDAATAGLHIASVAYHDLRLAKRALKHAAQCPREDGLVAGMSPGGCAYLPTFALQWLSAVWDYYKCTGDLAFLEEMWPYAERNLKAIHAFWRADGLHPIAGWNFVDWGYQTETGEVDTACNLHYLAGLRSSVTWAKKIGLNSSPYTEQESELKHLLTRRISDKLSRGGWEMLGYHSATLSMRLGLVNEPEACLAFMKAHMLDCFPNNLQAPRNDDPTKFKKQLITPYFAHFVMPVFIEAGQVDFVLDQFRKCWGEFLLAEGRTTWCEVFDTRWSHCHQWSGCPTWQLSRYLLGLSPRFDRGDGEYDFVLNPGSLSSASGRLPDPRGGWIEIEWAAVGDKIQYTLHSNNPLCLQFHDTSRTDFKSSFNMEMSSLKTAPQQANAAITIDY